MLVSLEDFYGSPLWINPMYVREIKPTRRGCKLSYAGKVIRLPVEADTLAAVINEGLPLPSEAYAALIEEERITQQQQAARIAAGAGA